MSLFYVPRTKQELVIFLKNRLVCTESSLKRMPKNQLYAIYFRFRKDIANAN